MDKDGKFYNYGLLSRPMSSASILPFLNLIYIIRNIYPNVHVVGVHDINSNIEKYFNKIEKSSFVEILHHSGNNNISRVLYYFTTQILVSLNIIKKKNCFVWIFFIDNGYIFPMLINLLLRNKIVIIIGGNQEKEVKLRGSFIDRIAYCFAKLNLLLCSNIIVYSLRLIPEWNLTPYRHKILIAHRHFLDFNTFTVTTPYHDHPNLIGYIGRLSGEKGVQHFTQALPAILSNNQDLHVLIGGDGQLKQEIEASLQEGGIADRVDLPGWISHDELPKYLNQLRLLVLPSYTEGLPNIMLEAMACGTPVLATPVGAIPDVIRDGETGFIMEDNSPECIARNVMRVLNDPDLEEVAERGKAFVEGEFTFEKVVERWKGILRDIR